MSDLINRFRHFYSASEIRADHEQEKKEAEEFYRGRSVVVAFPPYGLRTGRCVSIGFKRTSGFLEIALEVDVGGRRVRRKEDQLRGPSGKRTLMSQPRSMV